MVFWHSGKCPVARLHRAIPASHVSQFHFEMKRTFINAQKSRTEKIVNIARLCSHSIYHALYATMNFSRSWFFSLLVFDVLWCDAFLWFAIGSYTPYIYMRDDDDDDKLSVFSRFVSFFSFFFFGLFCCCCSSRPIHSNFFGRGRVHEFTHHSPPFTFYNFINMKCISHNLLTFPNE